ncbi:MAG: OmpA family protein [Paracoccaceae bacterium]
MKKFFTVPLMIGALGLSGCAQEAGYHRDVPVFGGAQQANFAAQDAYNLSNQRLKDLGRDFIENTDEVVTFAFDRANVDGAARSALDTQVAWLKRHPEVRMTIIGHTDLVGSERYNSGLGLRRARRVLSYLASKGISRGRLEAIASRGEREPVVQTQSRERRNRRTETTVSGFARNYVGTGLDGEYAHRVYNQYQSGGGGVN